MSRSRTTNFELQAAPESYPHWNWFEALALGLLALLGMDVLLALVVGIVLGIVAALSHNPELASHLNDESVGFGFAFYALSRAMGFGVVYWFLKRRATTLKEFGFRSFKVWPAIGRLALAAAIFFMVSGIVLAILGRFFPQLNLDQAQDLVFTNAQGTLQLGLAFVALVIIAPVAEEAIFRGLMLPAVAKKWGWLTGAFITSLIFGLVHMQLNVGIITFLLGLLLAWLATKSKSLWPAIMLHSFKNLVAFVVIFHIF